MAKKVFTGKLLIDGRGGAPIKDPYVVAEDGVILEVGSGRPPEALIGQAEFVEMPEAAIIPGLIDAHVHIALAALSGPKGLKADPTVLAFQGAKAARVALASGVTTLGDCGANYGITIQLREAIAKGQVPGARLWVAGPFITSTSGHAYEAVEAGADSAEELRKAIRQAVWDGADFIKIMASGGSGTPLSNRRRAQYSAEELRAAVEDAHRLGRRVHCHVNAAEAMRNCIQAGVDVLEHCNWLGIEEGSIDYDHEMARLAGKKGLSAGINCPAPFVPLTNRDGSAQDWGKQTRWNLMRRMQEAGVKIFFDTDAIGEEQDRLPKYMAQMVAEEKATAMEVIEMTTRIPAQALGLEAKLGTLEKGRLADMVFLSQNPLVDMSTVAAPLLVVKEGAIAAREGKAII